MFYSVFKIRIILPNLKCIHIGICFVLLTPLFYNQPYKVIKMSKHGFILTNNFPIVSQNHYIRNTNKFFELKQRLIILSDLWGLEDAEWMIPYHKQLEPHFKLEFYDSRKLVDLDLSDNSKNGIHAQFVNGGIDRAAHKLCRKEKLDVNVLAFSVGGVIAWKAALRGLPIKKLYAISSTRLRYETVKPNCKCAVYFGEEDQYKPNVNWHANLSLDCNYIENSEHEMYKEEEFANSLCKKIIKELTSQQNSPKNEARKNHRSNRNLRKTNSC